MKKNKLTNKNKKIAVNYMASLYDNCFNEIPQLNKPILDHIENFINSFESNNDREYIINEALKIHNKDFTSTMKEKNLRLKQYNDGKRSEKDIIIPTIPKEFI